MTAKFRPMLATPVDWTKLRYPLGAFAKIDGTRFVVLDGVVLSRTLKPFPNRFLQEAVGGWDLDMFDGEICVGPSNAKDVYHQTYSGVMSRDGEPDFKLQVFDLIDLERKQPYADRRKRLQDRVEYLDASIRQYVEVLPMVICHDRDEVLAAEGSFLGEGYEGIITRDMSTVYKFGRATTNSQELGKIKRMETSEARIIGMECMYSNQNEATSDARGYTQRSSHKENQVPLDTLGTLLCKDLETDIKFGIGTGFTAAQRKEIWDRQDDYIGKICTYNHFPIGVKHAPRHPSYKGLRDPIDM